MNGNSLNRGGRSETGPVRVIRQGTIAPEHVEFVHVMHNSSGGRVAFFFRVQRWDGTPGNREPDKRSELRWFPLDSLPGQIIDYCRTALGHIAAGESFSVYGW